MSSKILARIAGAGTTVFLLSLAIAGAASPAVAATSDLISDGSFEAPVVAPPWIQVPAGQSLGNWTVDAGNVELIHNGGNAADGQQYVDMDGSNAAGAIHQDLLTTAGRRYTIRFALAGNPEGGPTVKTLRVQFGAFTRTFTFDTTGHTWNAPGWVARTVTLPALNTTTRLSLQSLDDASPLSYGPLVDEVSVTPLNLANDGGFESPAVAPPWIQVRAGQAIGNWSVDAGNVELIHNGAIAEEGQQFVDLDASNAAGTIHQDVPTTLGNLYTIRFALAGNPEGGPAVKTLRVQFGAFTRTFTFDTTGRTWNNLGWATQTWTLPALSTTTRLTFQSLDAGSPLSYGPLLDAVSVG